MSEAELKKLLRNSIKLEPMHRRILYLFTALVWGSGIVWVYYYCNAEELNSLIRNPAQVLSMKVHAAVAFLYLILLGSMYSHVRIALKAKLNLVSGISILVILGLLTITGWMLYYVSGEALRGWASLVHWVVGALIPLLLFLHIQLGRKKR